MRLTSLDVFRGIAIASMILVNNASLGEQVYSFLDHADWQGCTFADLVFPFFLFIVGAAMSFSVPAYNPAQPPTKSIYWRILRRSAILFALGLFLNGFWNYDFSTIRIMGVLQRISVAYLLAALAIINLPRKWLWAIAGIILIGYWGTMSAIPVPEYGAGILTREGNLGAYIDRLIITTTHLYKGDNFRSLGDPEGLFSTLPAVVTVLSGYFSAQWLRVQPIQSRTSLGLVLFGIGCLGTGWVWGLEFPIIKKLWTSSYVLFTNGWCLLLLAACYELIEVRNYRRWGKPFEAMGLNAIFAFVASVLLIKILVKTHIGTGEAAPTTYTWLSQQILFFWTSPINASLLFAIATLLFWMGILYIMYRQRWFWKL